MNSFDVNSALPAQLQGLNPPQREAVEHVHGPILILAGAGSGKTRVLTRRVAHLVLEHGVDPSAIMAVTFTNKATSEMRERLGGLLGEHAKKLWVTTFHAGGLRILRRHGHLLSYPNNFVVYDDDDSKQLLRRVIKALNIDEKNNPPELFRSLIDRAKNDYIDAEKYAAGSKDFFENMAAEVYQRYQQELFKAGAMDFGDLLVNAVTLFRQERELLQLYRNHLQFILVDEFQDTNAVQYKLIRLLAEPRRNLLVVGDDDQSIYAFRGANISNILNFEKDFPETKVVTLDQNYRSTGAILGAAHAVIEKNAARKPKKLWTAGERGEKIITFTGYDEGDEAGYIADEIANRGPEGTALCEIAVFYRTNAQSRAIEEALIRRRIPYRIFGGLKFYERKEVKDVLAYLRLVSNGQDNQAFLRALNTPARGIGAQTLQHISDTAQQHGQSLWQAAVSLGEENKKIGAFVELIEGLKEVSRSAMLSELMEQVLARTGYEAKLRQSRDLNSESRIENLRELVAIGTSMDSQSVDHLEVLQAFLDRVTLTTSDEVSVDQRQHVAIGEDAVPDAVSLMTLHLAKGLEFPLVFLTGMEEGLLPHYRSLESLTAIEEERRLCYVGITRAMRQLYLTRAVQRGMFSSGGGFGVSGRYRKVSRFFDDIPPEYLEDRSRQTFDEPWWEKDEYSDPDPDSTTWWQRKQQRQEDDRGSDRMRGALVRGVAPKAGKPARAVTLTSADDLPELPEGAIPLRDCLEQVAPGLKVFHPHFGTGIIVEIDQKFGTDPLNSKIKVVFDQHDQKTLLLGKAKLAKV